MTLQRRQSREEKQKQEQKKTKSKWKLVKQISPDTKPRLLYERKAVWLFSCIRCSAKQKSLQMCAKLRHCHRWDRVAHHCKVDWCHLVKTLEYQQTDLDILQTLLNGQPVQSISDVTGDVVVLPFVHYQSSSCIQHVLYSGWI